MRVTNTMINNRMLLNINRNARQVDKLYNQLSSGKRVIFPSDDPILAARALKFRTNVFETEQYQRNVTQGLSWMEVTEGGFKNVLNITGRIRELLVQGASDENSYDDRLKIMTDVEQLVKQLGTEMSVSYAGRYVFSGYRTDQPPVIQKDQPADTTLVSNSAVTSTNSLFVTGSDGVTYNLSSTVLSGSGYINNITISGTDSIGNTVAVLPKTIDSLSDLTPAELQALTDPTSIDAYYVRDTGTLVLGTLLADSANSGNLGGSASLAVSYADTTNAFEINQNFKGTDIDSVDVIQWTTANNYSDLSLSEDVNILKLAYFNGVDNLKLTLGGAPLALTGEVSSMNNITFPIAANAVYFVKDTGTLVLGDDVARQMRAGGANLAVQYDKTGFEKGELNPIVYFDCVDKTTGKSYNMNDQDIEYEFGANTRINVNSLAKDVYTDKMYADLMDFCRTLSAIPTNTLESLMAGGLTSDQAKEKLQDEQDQLRQMSQTRINSLLGLMDSHISNVTRQHTDLGSRMSRLELIENRLEEDRINYKKLLSDNEDVDYTEAAMQLNTADSVYQAALQVGAKIIQLTLADYIR